MTVKEYAEVLYRWQTALEVIRAHDHTRLLASVGKSTLLDQTRCSDLDKEWDRINDRHAPTVDVGPTFVVDVD